jgi:hypothetical protein
MTSNPPLRKLRVYFRAYEPELPSTAFAFACGLGTQAAGDYVFVRPGSLNDLRARCQQFFECADQCDDADLVSYPHPYRPKSAAANETAEIARRHGLPCVFFRNADRPRPTRLRYGIIFQESVFTSRRTSCEFVHPSVVDDLLHGRQLQVRDKRAKPTVGFRGFQGTGRHREIIRWLIGGREAFYGSYLRKQALRHCVRSPLVDTRFELLRFGRIYENRDVLRDLYIRNTLESDYVLAIRGAGNFSYRLYETLSLGRIPVVPDTDLTLPLDDIIDWPRHCVWIEPKDFRRIPERIREFHDSLSPDEFRQLQRDNRRLWETYLEPTAYWRRTLFELVHNSKPRSIGARL